MGLGETDVQILFATGQAAMIPEGPFALARSWRSIPTSSSACSTRRPRRLRWSTSPSSLSRSLIGSRRNTAKALVTLR
jgi:hypothetical protein